MIPFKCGVYFQRALLCLTGEHDARWPFVVGLLMLDWCRVEGGSLLTRHWDGIACVLVFCSEILFNRQLPGFGEKDQYIKYFNSRTVGLHYVDVYPSHYSCTQYTKIKAFKLIL